MNKKEWAEQTREIIRNSETAELEYDGELRSDSTIHVISTEFSTDYILGALPPQIRKLTAIRLESAKSSEEDTTYHYTLRKRNLPFKKEFVGGSIVEHILQENRVGLLDQVEEYTVTNHGVILFTNELKQPELFKSMATSSFRLYKTYKPVNSKCDYAFVYRQQRTDTKEDAQKMKDTLSRYRVRQIEWDTQLDCDICKSDNSVEIKPTSRGNSERYKTTFHCTDCDTRLGSEKRLGDTIEGNQTGKAIEQKLKQKYKTAVGRPNNTI